MTDESQPDKPPLVVPAADAAPRAKASSYPEPFASRVAGRIKRPLGDMFGLTNIGVNLTTLEPGAQSALLHRHEKQDEFVYVLAGYPLLVTDLGKERMSPGDCAGFPKGGHAHHIVNDTDDRVTFLEIGDRTPGETAEYPDDDLTVSAGPDGDWLFTRKDGTRY